MLTLYQTIDLLSILNVCSVFVPVLTYLRVEKRCDGMKLMNFFIEIYSYLLQICLSSKDW